MIVIHFDGFKLFKWALIIGFVAAVFLGVEHDVNGWWL